MGAAYSLSTIGVTRALHTPNPIEIEPIVVEIQSREGRHAERQIVGETQKTGGADSLSTVVVTGAWDTPNLIEIEPVVLEIQSKEG